MKTQAVSSASDPMITSRSSLRSRLKTYAHEHDMTVREDDKRYELVWSRGAQQYFIEIDKGNGAVRAGHFLGTAHSPSITYDSLPTSLGSDTLEHLLDDQRAFLD